MHGGAGTLNAIPGLPPRLTALPAGCAFHPRCALAQDICRSAQPEEIAVRPGHVSRCHVALTPAFAEASA